MKLILPPAIERKLNAYVQAVDGEIAGMGRLEARDDGNLWVTDIAIYDQEVTGGTADLSSEALAHFQTDLVKQGRGGELKEWFLWWHSHASMGAFFSATDTGTIDRSTEFDQMVSLVVNKRRERKARFDIHSVNGIRTHIAIENLDIEVSPAMHPRILEIDKQIEELETEKLHIEYEVPEGIVEEVKDKVRQKTYPKMGFGKDKKNKSWLELPFDDHWSKNRKKDGGVTIPKKTIAAKKLTSERLLELLEYTEAQISAHTANGNADTVECEELRVDFGILNTEWEARVASSITNHQSADEDDYNTYWNGFRWVHMDEEEQHNYPIIGPKKHHGKDD